MSFGHSSIGVSSNIVHFSDRQMFCSHYLEDNGDVDEEIPPNL